VTMGVHHVDDVPRPMGQGLYRGKIQQRERIHAVGQLEAGDHSAERRIRERRAIAVEIRVDVKGAGEGGREGDSPREFVEPRIEQRMHMAALGRGLPEQLRTSDMAQDHVIEERPRGGLPASLSQRSGTMAE